jgi:putative acetyltransferase
VSELGIDAPDPQWGPYFQTRRLSGPPVRGTFRYAAPFDRV